VAPSVSIWLAGPDGSVAHAGVLMWHDMFVEQIPLTEKVLRTVIVYALLAVLFRLAGKRQPTTGGGVALTDR
jgi:hypothetical protein